MQKIKELFTAIKKYIKSNYWLQPLLLVLAVFVIVFGLQLIPTVSTTIKGWINPTDKCKECIQSNLEQVSEKIDNGEEIVVLIGSKDCSNCIKFYPVVDKYLGVKKDVDVYYISFDQENDEYVDTTITEELNLAFGEKLDTYYTSNRMGTIWDDELNTYLYDTPTMVKFNGGVVEDVQYGTTDYNGLLEFLGE